MTVSPSEQVEREFRSRLADLVEDHKRLVVKLILDMRERLAQLDEQEEGDE